MPTFGFGRKELSQSFATDITDKEDLEETKKIFTIPNLAGIAYAKLSSELVCMITLNKGKWDARTSDQVSRLVQYRWGIQDLNIFFCYPCLPGNY